LQPGEVVLDLGSGGGIDVLLSAKRVGPTGKAYALDMTDEMLALARANQEKAGVENVEFLKGAIESIPLPENTVDVIISNCVINLSGDKDRVLAEAFRVLKPEGGWRFRTWWCAARCQTEIRRSMELWVGCIAGALRKRSIRRSWDGRDSSRLRWSLPEFIRLRRRGIFLAAAGLDPDTVGPQIDGKFISAFVRAVKPASKTACCGPACCN